MNNYPDGFDQGLLDGPSWEGEIDVDCHEKASLVIVPHAMGVDISRGGSVTLNAAALGIWGTDDCPFEGFVEAERWGDIITWKCPLCGADHEDEA